MIYIYSKNAFNKYWVIGYIDFNITEFLMYSAPCTFSSFCKHFPLPTSISVI